MILFKEIYNKAINLFNDPDIQSAYVHDTVRWEKIMYTYLQNGINLFTNPTKISFLLLDQDPPEGVLEVFDGADTATYTVTATPPEGCDMSFIIGDEYDREAVYNATNHTVTFSQPVTTGTKCSVEFYYAGAFLTDFSSAATNVTSADIIQYRVTEILARALVLVWAQNERDFALDIRNLLTDTDFKIYSPANSIEAKVKWVKRLDNEFRTMQNKLAWDLVSRKYSRGDFYG